MKGPESKIISLTNRPIVPWNKGAFVGAKPPLKPKQVWAILLDLVREKRIRDVALFDLAIDSKLRGCDLVKLQIGQVVINTAARERAMVIQKKTGKPVQFELTTQIRESLITWLNHRGGGLQDFVFPSRADSVCHLGKRQHSRLVGDWVNRNPTGHNRTGSCPLLAALVTVAIAHVAAPVARCHGKATASHGDGDISGRDGKT